MKKLPILLIYSLVCTPLFGEQPLQSPPESNFLVDKRRNITKVYDVGTRDQLQVNNQYGDVKVNLWTKKEIRIDIVITASASSDDKADQYLNSVSIEERKDGNQIILKTDINKSIFGTSGWSPWVNGGGKKSIKIDYTVSMPENIPLNILNKFGDVSIPTFQAILKVQAAYGNFYAESLKNEQNTIAISFGNAIIKTIDGGKVDSKYSDLKMEKAGSLTLVNKFGKLNIGVVNKLLADIDYTSAKIGALNQDARVNLNFSNNFLIGQCTADNVNINASYSSVILPAEPGSFDVTVTHGSFRYPSANVSFTTHPADNKKTHNTRQYEGKIGVSSTNSSGTNLKIVSRYGNVSLKD